MSQGVELLLLFAVLPFIVAGGVIWFVSWRAGQGPPPVRTSHILATGDPGQAEVLTARNMGGFLDPRPMLRVGLRITMADGSGPFELEVTQSIPRSRLREIAAGNMTEVRVTADRSAAAIVFSDPDN